MNENLKKDGNKILNKRDFNNNLHETIRYYLRQPSNKLIAWAAFGGRNYKNEEDFDPNFVKPAFFRLLNDLNIAIDSYLKHHSNSIDYSTYDSTLKTLKLLTKQFMSEDNKGLSDLFLNYEYGGFIWWATSVILYREVSLLAFDNSHYSIAMDFHKICKTNYEEIVYTNHKFEDYFKHELSYKNKKGNDARWQGHVENIRRKYLELDNKRQSQFGKKLTIKSVAMWIYNNHNEEDLEYETIRDHLSKARKGIFSND